MISDHSHNGHTGSRGGLLGRLARTDKLMHFTHEAHYYHSKRYSVGKMHQGGYLVWGLFSNRDKNILYNC